MKCAAFRFGVGAPIEDRDNVAGDADEILASRLKRVLESDASEEMSTRDHASSTKDGESVLAGKMNYKGVSKRRERMQRLRDRIRRSSREGSLRDAREGMLKTARRHLLRGSRSVRDSDEQGTSGGRVGDAVLLYPTFANQDREHPGSWRVHVRGWIYRPRDIGMRHLTAAAALMQREVNADVSTLRYALCGSAPLPLGLFERFEQATGVKILEGYGMTEATCLVSCNPATGERKVGSVGLPFPYTDVRILMCDEVGNVVKECGTDEVGEICVSNPGVIPGGTYTEPERNVNLYADNDWLRTGDLGRIDGDGYLWITGRAKDLIIRGGHNIDPALIEEALARHPAVAMAGAVGQPDAHSGEVPCVYVELAAGQEASIEALQAWADERIPERAAHPKHIEILPEIPKTAVGKVFKPDLRKLAIARVYGAALAKAGIKVEVTVVEDRKLGLVAELHPVGKAVSQAELRAVLDVFARPFRLIEKG